MEWVRNGIKQASGASEAVRSEWAEWAECEWTNVESDRVAFYKRDCYMKKHAHIISAQALGDTQWVFHDKKASPCYVSIDM